MKKRIGRDALNYFDTARLLLPEKYRVSLCAAGVCDAEELRLRTNRPLSCLAAGHETEIDGSAISEGDILFALERATGASMHSAADSLKAGFVSYRGLRIGVCGEAVTEAGKIVGFRHYSSLCIRIPHVCEGCCGELTGELFRGGMENTLIIAPPGVGKTTALRELIRTAADRGMRVGVVDERNELSGTDRGAAAFSLGRCADVLVHTPRHEGAVLLLRGMSPELIAMDEIRRREDIAALREICGCGVKLLATAHAASLADMQKRSVYRELLNDGIFQRLVTIQIANGVRHYDHRRLPCSD